MSIPPVRYRSNQPLISPRAYEYLRRVLEDGYLSPGPLVREFERQWAEMCGLRFGVAVQSGTAALHIALRSAGIVPGDDVIVPALTCPDTLNAAVMAGARPVIVDIEPERLGLDPERISSAVTGRTRAVLPVHLYGAPVRPEVFEEAERLGLMVIEDCAEAHGATSLDGRMVGSLGLAGCFSFRGDKMIGIGTGGMILTNSEPLAKRAHYLIGLASPGGWDRYGSTEMCFSYELSNVHAALGMAQLEMLLQTIEAKRQIASWYGELLPQGLVDKPALIPGHVWWRYCALLREGSPREVHQSLAQEGIEILPPFVPMYRLAQFADGYDWRDYPVAEDAFRRLISLPSAPQLRREDVEHIVGSLTWAIQSQKTAGPPH